VRNNVFVKREDRYLQSQRTDNEKPKHFVENAYVSPNGEKLVCVTKRAQLYWAQLHGVGDGFSRITVNADENNIDEEEEEQEKEEEEEEKQQQEKDDDDQKKSFARDDTVNIVIGQHQNVIGGVCWAGAGQTVRLDTRGAVVEFQRGPKNEKKNRRDTRGAAYNFWKYKYIYIYIYMKSPTCLLNANNNNYYYYIT